MNSLEFVLPGVLLLLQWTAFGEPTAVRALTCALVIFGVAVTLWCSVANIVYLTQ